MSNDVVTAPSDVIPWRVGILQRVLPAYRVPFFDLLAFSCAHGLSLAAGNAQPDESLGPVGRLHQAEFHHLDNRYYGLGRWQVFYQQGYHQWLETWQPEVLVTDTNLRGISTPGAVQWMKQRGGKVVGWGLGAGAIQGLASVLRKRMMAQYDALISYSQNGADAYHALGFPKERIFIAPNAVTVAPSAPPPNRNPNFEGIPQILFVGRLQERKRLDVLMRACADLPLEEQPILQIVGDGPARAKLEELAHELYPQTRFWGDLRGDALDARFVQADLFVLPGTGGLAVQQAMCFALPVVVAEADGTQADLVRPENGRLAVPGDVANLRDTLQQLLSDPGKLRTMGLASYRIVKDEINLERMVAVFSSVIQFVMDH